MANEKRLIAFDPVTFEAFTRSLTKFRNPYDPYDDGYLDATQRIEEWLESNTVDAVEVVRCKDCENWREPWLVDQTLGVCQVGKKTLTEPNHFCSYGERRTDNG